MNRLPAQGDVINIGRKELLVIHATRKNVDADGSVYVIDTVPHVEHPSGTGTVVATPVQYYFSPYLFSPDEKFAPNLKDVRLSGTVKFKQKVAIEVTKFKEA
jgi:hypothetical protein